ncbi:MAG: DUF2079 domain-containing protein [Candidatus Nanopelagicales bacterium]
MPPLGIDQSSPARNRLRWRPKFSPVVVLTGVTFIVSLAYSWARHALFLTAGYDLGIFDQAVRRYSRFAAPLVPLKGPDFNLLGDHFHPILVLAAPGYWLFDDPRTLLVIQSALVAASVALVYRFARRRMSPNSALAVGGAYALGWPITGLIDYDFHEIAFALPVLAMTIDALDRRADRQLLACSVLLLLIREDMGAVVLVVGIIRMLGRPRWFGATLAAAGIGAFLVVTRVAIPAMSATGGFAYWTFDSLGPDLTSAIRHLLLDPVDSAVIFFTPAVKIQTLALLLVPLLFLPLASPYALLSLPLLAERLFNSREMLWSTHYHYNAPIWLILVMATIDAGQRLGIWSQPRLRQAVIAWMLVSQLLAMALPGTPPVVRRMINGNAWRASEHTVAQRMAVAAIPPNVCVVADDRLVPHLTRTNRVTVPGVAGPVPDYVVIDSTEPYPALESGATSAEVISMAKQAGYETAWNRDGIYVLRAPEVKQRAECAP